MLIALTVISLMPSRQAGETIKTEPVEDDVTAADYIRNPTDNDVQSGHVRTQLIGRTEETETQENPSSGTIDIPLDCESSEVATAIDNWKGQKGLARTKPNWPYRFYEDSLLEQLSASGDPEASFQLAMNYRWRSLYDGAGQSWDPDKDVSMLTTNSSPNPEELPLVSAYLFRAAAQGYLYSYVELADYTMEILPFQIQQLMSLPEEERYGIEESSLVALSQAMSSAYSAIPSAIYFEDDTAIVSVADKFSSEDGNQLLMRLYNTQVERLRKARTDMSEPPFSKDVPGAVRRMIGECGDIY